MRLFSHSRLETFRKCPRQFYYRYIKKTDSPYEGVEAYMGKQVHNVLEKVYEDLGKGRLMQFATAKNYYEHYFEDGYHENIVIVREKQGLDKNYYKDLGVTCLKNYYDDEFPFNDGQTIGIEKYVEFKVGGGDCKCDNQIAYVCECRHQWDIDAGCRCWCSCDFMRGFVDRISINNGVLKIHDYKTGKKILGPAAADNDEQLASYEIAIRKANPEIEKIQLVWHFLQKKKTVTSSRTQEQLDKLDNKVENTIRIIDEHTERMEFPAKPSPLCAWCSYNKVCPSARKWEPK